MEEIHHSSKGHGLWSQTLWVQILALTFAGCATSGKLVNLSVPQFSHLQNRGNNSASLIETPKK